MKTVFSCRGAGIRPAQERDRPRVRRRGPLRVQLTPRSPSPFQHAALNLQSTDAFTLSASCVRNMPLQGLSLIFPQHREDPELRNPLCDGHLKNSGREIGAQNPVMRTDTSPPQVLHHLSASCSARIARFLDFDPCEGEYSSRKPVIRQSRWP